MCYLILPMNFRKIFISILSIILVISMTFSAFLLRPKKAEAVVFVPINDIQNNLKEQMADGIAYFLAKQFLRQITTSVVDWINTGFKGGPSFVTDPAGFFTNSADEILGGLIEGTDLNFLCSPFSIDVRLNLKFRYRPFQRRISCTLSDVIKNSVGAVKGASINGFMLGDWKQGGWPAFVSMTTEPQNNFYGASVEAEYEAGIRIGSMELMKRDELNQGGGFLSWRSCETRGVVDEGTIKYGEATQQEQEDYYETTSAEKTIKEQNKSKCSIETPGSTIANQLDKSLGIPAEELGLADEFNEIVNALFAQLVTQALSAGVRSLSGGGSSGSSSGGESYESYLERIRAEEALKNTELQRIINKINSFVEQNIGEERKYLETKKASLNITLEAKNIFEGAKKCFVDKVGSINNLNNAQKDFADLQIGQIETTISTKIIPTSSKLLDEVSKSQSAVNSMEEISQSARTAQTINDTIIPSQKLDDILSSNLLHSSQNTSEALAEQAIVRQKMTPLISAGNLKVRACELFPNVLNNTPIP